MALLKLLCLIFSTSTAKSQTSWQQTGGSVTFTIKNWGINVDGKFAHFQTYLFFDPQKLSSSYLVGTVKVSSINTGIQKRDSDLMSEDYFDVRNHPQIEISSVKLEKRNGSFSGLFNITIKGITRQMEIPFTFIQNGDNAEFKASFVIDRREFDVGGRSGLAIFLSDNAYVSVLIKAKKSG